MKRKSMYKSTEVLNYVSYSGAVKSQIWDKSG